MDFSELVNAIDKNDRTKVNQLLKKLRPRLVRFLEIHMNAERQDAEDCVQQTMLKSLPTIREGNIRNKDQILSFFLTSTRNNYLNLVNKQKESLYEDHSEPFGHEPLQLFSLLDKERRRILEWCKKRLSDDYHEFIEYWFTYPDTDATAVASHFGISVNNAWIKKHRIIKKLNECYEKESEK